MTRQSSFGILVLAPAALAALTIACRAGSSYSLGNYAWLDENMNGIQDADEPGMEDVLIEL